jgi:hypothetical protein
MLVGDATARAAAQGCRFWWGDTELPQVTDTKYLGVWLSHDWTWARHIAEAKKKGFAAFHKWAHVLASSRVKVDVKLRIIQRNIRPVMEYGMEVWGPPPGPDAAAQLAPLDEVLQRACRVASGVRAHADERAWQRRQCLSSDVLTAALRALPMDSTCDVARFRYAERLRVVADLGTPAPGSASTCLAFRAHAYAHLPADHEWWLRAQRASALRERQDAVRPQRIDNATITEYVAEQVAAAQQRAAHAVPAMPSSTTSGRLLKRPHADPHYNPVHAALEPAPAACPRPADLWDDIFRTLPANSAARPRLWQAWGCDPEDTEAVWRECVPWVTEPAAMVACERLDVQDTVCRLVAAYLLGVGAALSDSEVPSGHLNALMLPVAGGATVSCAGGCDYDSDDEAWLRDDIPSLEWAGLEARSSAAVDDAATSAAVPVAYPVSAPPGSAEAEALWRTVKSASLGFFGQSDVPWAYIPACRWTPHRCPSWCMQRTLEHRAACRRCKRIYARRNGRDAASAQIAQRSASCNRGDAAALSNLVHDAVTTVQHGTYV